ncbi:hypothetical protein [Thiocapsa sp.]|uniref:hypothetical protein n=1 Tax=Thiocapsa sp. TaxID=2024551 RepID=UPI002B7349D3|nr:hypothetical protein [Thiocapsa sp.]HSO84702.1 hypothetical protein [Thiocapsa sp.]
MDLHDLKWALIGLFLVAAVWMTLRIMRRRGVTLLDPTPQSVVLSPRTAATDDGENRGKSGDWC